MERALDEESAALLMRDEDEAVQVADLIAAEHVTLAVKDPAALLAHPPRRRVLPGRRDPRGDTLQYA